MSDEDVLAKAVMTESILITNDKDFGEMIFRERRQHRGVIFLRLADERSANKIAVLRSLLNAHAERLTDKFATVAETKVRITK